MGELHVQLWGAGPRVVLVHGDVVAGERAWRRQRPLEGRWQLVVPDRAGYGRSPANGRIDFELEAAQLERLLRDGDHLVGHSYGGVVSLLVAAAGRRRLRSLTLLEPPAYSVARGDPVIEDTLEQLVAFWERGPREPELFLRGFGELVGQRFPPPPLARELVHGARLLMDERVPWEAEFDTGAIRAQRLPALVVSGGHTESFERVADALADQLDATRAVLDGVGHNIPGAGERLNELLERLWTTVAPASGSGAERGSTGPL